MVAVPEQMLLGVPGKINHTRNAVNLFILDLRQVFHITTQDIYIFGTILKQKGAMLRFVIRGPTRGNGHAHDN